VYKHYQLTLFCLFCFLTASVATAAYDPYSTYPEVSTHGYLVRNNETLRSYYDRQTNNQHCTTPLYKELQRYKESLKSFYQWDTALNFGVSLGFGAILANTSCDQNFRNWYQEDFRSSGTDDWSRFCKIFGEGHYVIPAYLATSIAYRYLDEYWNLDAGSGKNFGQWASRSSQAILVGFPVLLVGQYATGASRPSDEKSWGSHWKPFTDNHGISGHAFLGAVPFITAAQMTDHFLLKSVLYFGSTLTGWSRINDDAHYLSQAILGWYLAYLSCRAVTRTENPNFGRGLTVFPLVTADTVGVGITYRR